MKNMRIVYLIHSIHSVGGMEKVLTSKANWLSTYPGIEVFIVTSRLHGRQPFFRLSPEVHLIDIDVSDRTRPRRYRRGLQKVLDEVKPDITISLCGSDVFQLLKCGNAGVRLAEFHFPHDKFARKYPGFPLYASLRTKRLESALQGYDKFVTLCKYDLDYYRKVFAEPEKVVQIYDPVDDRTSEVSDLTAGRFIAVGRLSKEKNFADAIRIWAEVVKVHPDWKLDIFGAGKEYKALDRLRHELGMDAYVTLKGSSTSLAEEYGNSSGLLVTSSYEGIGLVILEAESFRLPVVSYISPGGIPEILTDGENAFLVPLGDVKAGADRVCRLIEDAGLRNAMGDKALENSSGFSRDAIMGEWVELFNRILV